MPSAVAHTARLIGERLRRVCRLGMSGVSGSGYQTYTKKQITRITQIRKLRNRCNLRFVCLMPMLYWAVSPIWSFHLRNQF